MGWAHFLKVEKQNGSVPFHRGSMPAANPPRLMHCEGEMQSACLVVRHAPNVIVEPENLLVLRWNGGLGTLPVTQKILKLSG